MPLGIFSIFLEKEFISLMKVENGAETLHQNDIIITIWSYVPPYSITDIRCSRFLSMI
jgi:hypothetical protein